MDRRWGHVKQLKTDQSSHTLWTLQSFPNWSKDVRASINQSIRDYWPSPVTCQDKSPKRQLEPCPEAGELGRLDLQKVTVQHRRACCNACPAHPHLGSHLQKCCEQSWQYCRPPCSVHSLSFHKFPGIPVSRLSGCCQSFVLPLAGDGYSRARMSPGYSYLQSASAESQAVRSLHSTGSTKLSLTWLFLTLSRFEFS